MAMPNDEKKATQPPVAFRGAIQRPDPVGPPKPPVPTLGGTSLSQQRNPPTESELVAALQRPLLGDQSTGPPRTEHPYKPGSIPPNPVIAPPPPKTSPPAPNTAPAVNQDLANQYMKRNFAGTDIFRKAGTNEFSDAGALKKMGVDPSKVADAKVVDRSALGLGYNMQRVTPPELSGTTLMATNNPRMQSQVGQPTFDGLQRPVDPTAAQFRQAARAYEQANPGTWVSGGSLTIQPTGKSMAVMRDDKTGDVVKDKDGNVQFVPFATTDPAELTKVEQEIAALPEADQERYKTAMAAQAKKVDEAAAVNAQADVMNKLGKEYMQPGVLGIPGNPQTLGYITNPATRPGSLEKAQADEALASKKQAARFKQDLALKFAGQPIRLGNISLPNTKENIDVVAKIMGNPVLLQYLLSQDGSAAITPDQLQAILGQAG